MVDRVNPEVEVFGHIVEEVVNTSLLEVVVEVFVANIHMVLTPASTVYLKEESFADWDIGVHRYTCWNSAPYCVTDLYG
jgi:hypothetical protein